MLRSPQAGCSARSGKGSTIRLRAVVRSQSRCRAPCLQDTDSSGQPSFLRFPSRIILPHSLCRGGGRTVRQALGRSSRGLLPPLTSHASGRHWCSMYRQAQFALPGLLWPSPLPRRIHLAHAGSRAARPREVLRAVVESLVPILVEVGFQPLETAPALHGHLLNSVHRTHSIRHRSVISLGARCPPMRGTMAFPIFRATFTEQFARIFFRPSRSPY